MKFKRIAVLSAALGLAGALACAARGGESVFNVVAIRVNNQSVSVRDVELLYHDSYSLIQDKLRRGELKAENLEQAVRLAWADALETAIQDKVLDQRAEARKKEIINFYLQRAGTVLGNDKAYDMFRRLEQDYLRKFRQQMVAAAGGEEELIKALKRRGQTLKQWDENLEKELFRRDVIGMELGDAVVKPSDLKEYYDKHPDQFGQSEAWRLRRIRIAKNKFSSPDIALEAARLTKESIGKGKDFAEIAAKLSDDAEYAATGGLMTRNNQTDLPSGAFPAEEKIASGLKDSGVSEPIDAGDWYVLIQRLGHRDARVLKFEEASDKAEALVYMEKMKQKKKEMYERLKRNSFVDILQKDPPENLLKKQ